MCQLQESVRKRGFSVVDMGDNAEVSNVVHDERGNLVKVNERRQLTLTRLAWHQNNKE